MQQSLEQLLVKMMTSLYNRYDMSDEKTVLARRFLKISRDDLNASRILNERGIYALAVFHLQQAVEKATKVQCLLSGIVTHEEIRRIRHESLRGQQIIASKFSRFIRTLAQANPKLDVVLRLDELMGKKRRLEIAKLNATEIDVVLSACDHQAKSTDLPRLLAKDRLESILMRMKRDRLDLEISDGDAKAVLDAFEKLTPALASAVENFAFLYVASAITFPHAVSTRYPGGEMNPWDYNESLGIVNRLPELVKRFDKVIESLDTQLNRNLG